MKPCKHPTCPDDGPCRRVKVKKQRTPLKRNKKAIRRVSAKRKAINQGYAQKSREWLKTRPFCEMRTPACTGRTECVHHVRGRIGVLLKDDRWWMAACYACNLWVEINDAKAREMGLKKSKHFKENKMEFKIGNFVIVSGDNDSFYLEQPLIVVKYDKEDSTYLCCSLFVDDPELEWVKETSLSIMPNGYKWKFDLIGAEVKYIGEDDVYDDFKKGTIGTITDVDQSDETVKFEYNDGAVSEWIDLTDIEVIKQNQSAETWEESKVDWGKGWD